MINVMDFIILMVGHISSQTECHFRSQTSGERTRNSATTASPWWVAGVISSFYKYLSKYKHIYIYYIYI